MFLIPVCYTHLMTLMNTLLLFMNYLGNIAVVNAIVAATASIEQALFNYEHFSCT